MARRYSTDDAPRPRQVFRMPAFDTSFRDSDERVIGDEVLASATRQAIDDPSGGKMLLLIRLCALEGI